MERTMPRLGIAKHLDRSSHYAGVRLPHLLTTRALAPQTRGGATLTAKMPWAPKSAIVVGAAIASTQEGYRR